MSLKQIVDLLRFRTADESLVTALGQAGDGSIPLGAQIPHRQYRSLEGRWRSMRAAMRFKHDIVPDRAGYQNDAADVEHGRVVGVADPDADQTLCGIADGPVVAPVGGGAGLDRGEGQSDWSHRRRGI